MDEAVMDEAVMDEAVMDEAVMDEAVMRCEVCGDGGLETLYYGKQVCTLGRHVRKVCAVSYHWDFRYKACPRGNLLLPSRYPKSP